MPPVGHFFTRCGDALDAHSIVGIDGPISVMFAQNPNALGTFAGCELFLHLASRRLSSASTNIGMLKSRRSEGRCKPALHSIGAAPADEHDMAVLGAFLSLLQWRRIYRGFGRIIGSRHQPCWWPMLVFGVMLADHFIMRTAFFSISRLWTNINACPEMRHQHCQGATRAAIE
jgi:hypothetical protein